MQCLAVKALLDQSEGATGCYSVKNAYEEGRGQHFRGGSCVFHLLMAAQLFMGAETEFQSFSICRKLCVLYISS